jgi:hypothetical protein
MKKILKNDPNKTVSGKKQTVEHERKSLGKKIQNWRSLSDLYYNWFERIVLQYKQLSLMILSFD